MEWSPQQNAGLLKTGRWVMDPASPQVFCLFGFAGTGKTTLAQHLVDPGEWVFASYTGKAAHVLRQKGCVGATTIHSLIYRPAGESRAKTILLLETRINQLESKLVRDATEETELVRRRAQLKDAQDKNRPQYALWENSPLAEARVKGIVVDEVSMVDEYLARDLESFGKKILVLGDPFQLPPVGGGGYYTSRVPDVQLTEVHRHAKESGILRLATDIREGKDIDTWATKDGAEVGDVTVRHRHDFDPQDLKMTAMNADQILVGRNATRKSTNADYRKTIGRTELGPVPGDRLVCLRNDRGFGLYNGSQWIVEEAQNDYGCNSSTLALRSDDDPSVSVRCPAWIHHMVGSSETLTAMDRDDRRSQMEFDHAYAMTVHKGQGSQWKDVMLVDESASFSRDGAAFGKRWLYTGVTRASERLTVVLP